MKLSIIIDGQDHTLEIVRENGLSYRFDGVPFAAEYAEIAPGVYSLLLGAKTFRVRVSPGAGGDPGEFAVHVGPVRCAVSVRDPRRWRGGGTMQSPEGEQNIKALMPGKVVRVLVSEGHTVQRGDGLIVVEAMKMQNEIKSPKDGTVRKMLVREGQPVNAGESLLIVK